MQLRDFIAFGYTGFEFWFPGYKLSRLCAQKSTAESNSSLMACRYTCCSCPTTDRSPPLPVTQFQWVVVLSLIGRYHNGHVQAISLCYSIQALYCTCTAVKCLSQILVMVSSNHCHVTQIFFCHFSTHHGKWNYFARPSSHFNTTSNRQGLRCEAMVVFHEAPSWPAALATEA